MVNPKILPLALILSLIYVYSCVYHKIIHIYSYDGYVTQEQYLDKSHASEESISNMIYGSKNETKDMKHKRHKTANTIKGLNGLLYIDENASRLPINKTSAKSEDYGFCRHSFQRISKKINVILNRLRRSVKLYNFLRASYSSGELSRIW